MSMTTRTSGDYRQTRQKSPSASRDPFVLTFWTGDPVEALGADAAGIQRVGVDLERLGKAERQAGRSTWISPHTCDDLVAVGRVLTRAHLFARINPIHRGTRDEIEHVLAAGVQVVMVPMIATAGDAADFAGLVGGRACAVVLIERREGLENLAAIADVDGVDEIHVGLNDLSLSLNLPNRWAALAGNLMSDAAACVRAAGRPFGFGGIGRAYDVNLPIPSDLIYSEYARTGATRALIARSFDVGGATFAAEIQSALDRLAEWRQASAESLAAAHTELGSRVRLAGTW